MFLTVEDVLELHDEQLQRFGGTAGVRDRGALESAVAVPAEGFALVIERLNRTRNAFSLPAMKLNLHHWSVVDADELAPSLGDRWQYFFDCILELGVVPEFASAPVP